MSALVRPPGAAQGRAAFVFIFITVLLDMLALGIIVPVLPGLVVFFRSCDTASAAASSGVFGSVWAAMQFIFSPILGSLSDIGVFETLEGALPEPGPIDLVKTSDGCRIDNLPNWYFLDWQQIQ